MNKNPLVKYLLISPNLPVGSFCYSEGLESYIKIKNLEESDHIKNLITNELKIGQIRIEAKCLIEFYDIFIELKDAVNVKNNKRRLLSLDQWLLASRDCVEIRDQQTQMAKSLFELTNEFGFKYLYEKNKSISWSLAWSWACFSFQINKSEMIENFIYAWTANQLSAAIRLIPMGSIKAQTIQLELLDLISEVSYEIVDRNINDLYVGNISLSMAQQNHNDLYTKLFRN
ncbi:urease accessory protein UreF [Prochlorococcus sp. AH-716-E13]|nr:urease accessory protein UreF [Prochlorococcus sp. AH-716-E13]